MPRIANTTNAETKFLRAFAKNPFGPPAEQWPTPTILRRWLKRPSFRRALASLVDTHRFTADLHLAAASSHAAHTLELSLQPKPDDKPKDLTPPMLTSLLRILNLSHVRQRFTPPPPTPTEKPQPKKTGAPFKRAMEWSDEEAAHLLGVIEGTIVPQDHHTTSDHYPPHHDEDDQ